ncbi:conserved hypothetical protein [uncultured Thiomicrorhabdus sp.]
MNDDTWHYAVKEVESDLDEDKEYDLVEVYPIGDKQAWSENVTFRGDSPADVAKWLRIAADDVEKHGVMEVKE